MHTLGSALGTNDVPVSPVPPGPSLMPIFRLPSVSSNTKIMRRIPTSEVRQKAVLVKRKDEALEAALQAKLGLTREDLHIINGDDSRSIRSYSSTPSLPSLTMPFPISPLKSMHGGKSRRRSKKSKKRRRTKLEPRNEFAVSCVNVIYRPSWP